MNNIEKIIASTIAKNTIEAMQKQLAERLKSMTVGEILGGKLPKLTSAPRRRTKRRQVDTAKKVVNIIKKLHATSDNQWRTVADLAKRAGISKPGSHTRRMMTRGFRVGGKFQKPLFEGNGRYTVAFRVRRAKA